MIRKILKWIGIVLGSLIGLLVVTFVALYLIGTVKWNRLHGTYDVPVESITIPTDQPRAQALARLLDALDVPARACWLAG